jgi:hypothetical protein
MNLRKLLICVIIYDISFIEYSKNLGIFYDSNISQIKFAAEYIKKALLTLQGGNLSSGLKENGYGLFTTISLKPLIGYWGRCQRCYVRRLQIAKNINYNGYTVIYNNQESSAIIRRWIKINLALDNQSNTFGKLASSSKIKGIPNVWDFSFWTSWFDEMDRNRKSLTLVCKRY